MAGATVCHALALLQAQYHVLGRLRFVVLVHGQQLGGSFVDAIGAQRGLRVARVFAGHGIGQLQYMQCPQRDVSQVTDRRGHNIQRAVRIMLRSCRFACGAEG